MWKWYRKSKNFVPDDMDTLEATDDIYGMPETPFTIYDLAKSDPEFAASMPKYWLAEDPAEAFADYLDSGIPDAVIRLMRIFGVEKRSSVCDLGCGAGHLVYSLMKRGYRHLSAMDPSADGPGFLKSNAPQIEIIRSIEVCGAASHHISTPSFQTERSTIGITSPLSPAMRAEQ